MDAEIRRLERAASSGDEQAAALLTRARMRCALVPPGPSIDAYDRARLEGHREGRSWVTVEWIERHGSDDLRPFRAGDVITARLHTRHRLVLERRLARCDRCEMQIEVFEPENWQGPVARGYDCFCSRRLQAEAIHRAAREARAHALWPTWPGPDTSWRFMLELVLDGVRCSGALTYRVPAVTGAGGGFARTGTGEFQGRL